MQDKDLIIAQLTEQNLFLSIQVKTLEEKVALLMQELQKKAVRKDSANSSLPPSQDLLPRKQSLREPSARKTGGQLGHEGHSLEMSASPDKVVELKSSFCGSCGGALPEGGQVLRSRRQVVDLPPIKPIYEEYRQYSCVCPRCSNVQVADFPAGVNAPIQYGPTVEALVAYFSVYQFIPFARLSRLMAQCFSMPISQGSIDSLLKRHASRCGIVLSRIRQELEKAACVGSDETGANVNGTKWWIWVWQSLQATLIVAAPSRGAKAVQDTWKEGLSNAVLVSDRWAAQLKTQARGHQICLAHLLRDLAFLEQTEAHPFATQFRLFLLKVFDVRKALVERGSAARADEAQAVLLEAELNALLAQPIDRQTAQGTATFQVSMIKCRNSILPCLYDLEVPPDNNASERAIRNVKVKQKVSGMFKSGQNAFCNIRSVIDTLIKKQVDVLSCLIQIARIQPE
jgi:transposase